MKRRHRNRQPSFVTVGCRLSEGEYRRLQELALDSDTTMSDVLRQLIRAEHDRRLTLAAMKEG